MLGRMRWPDVGAPAGSEAPLLLVPIGSLEQHGPALCLATDAMVAATVSRLAASRLAGRDGVPPIHVAPTLPYGASADHEDFPGTVSIGTEALRLVLVELARSACRWAQGVVFVNGHGGSVETIAEATLLLRSEGRGVAWTSCRASGSDAHAGRTETSLMLALAPDTVDTARLAPGVTDPVSGLMPRLRAQGVRAISPSGVLGDPTTASPELGSRLLADMVDHLVGELGDLDVAPTGRLRRLAAARA
jgi:mycofactocin system creatininase family protein